MRYKSFQSCFEKSLNEIEGKIVCDNCNIIVDKYIIVYHKNNFFFKPIENRICISCDRDIKLGKILK